MMDSDTTMDGKTGDCVDALKSITEARNILYRVVVAKAEHSLSANEGVEEVLPVFLLGDLVITSRVVLTLVDDVSRLTEEVAGLEGRLARMEEILYAHVLGKGV
jgi:hypothetical protein